jgi:hypothetical protein
VADNTTLNTGSGGDVIASDDIGGVKHQRVKMSVGADGAASDAIPVSNGLDTTAAGVQAVGLVAQLDDTGTGTVTENQFAPVRLSSRRALLVEGVASGTVIPVSDGGGALTVDNGGTFAVQVSSLPASTNTLEVVGDAAHDAAAAGNPVLVGAEFDDTTPDSVDEGDVGRLRISANRNLYTTLRDAAGNERGANVNGSNQLEVAVGNTVTVGSHAVTNAGTFATQVDGAALTALQLIDDAVKTDDAPFTPGTDKVLMIGAQLDATGPDSVDEGDAGALRMTADRALHISLRDSAGNNRGANVNASNQLSVSVDNTVTVASHAVTNAGTFAVQADAVIPGTGATNLGKAEDAAHSTGDVGVMALGVRAASPTERSAGPTDGDYEPFATNEVGAVWTSPTHSANGGASTFNASSSDGATALTNSAQAVKASAGNLIGYFIYNPNATAQFVQFFNTASGSVTVGTTNPLFMLTIPPTSAANLWMLGGIAFGTAISIAATSTAGGNGAPGTALDAVVWYK